MYSHKDKVAVVTGGGKGIGRAISVALAREGYDLALVARDREALNDTKIRIETETGRRVLVSQTDVTNPDEIKRLRRIVEKEFNRVDVLINNAAGWLSGTLVDANVDEIHGAIDTTVKGPIWMCREFWSHLKSAEPGIIVNITTLGARPGRSNATPVYVAAKFGLAGFTDAVRRLGIKDGILVTEILPGSVASDFDIDDPIDAVMQKYGQSKAHPRDVAEAVIFSLSRSKTSMVEEVGLPSVGDWFEDFSRY